MPGNAARNTPADDPVARLFNAPMEWVKDFQADLFGDLVPLVESNYPTEPGPDGRAIVGLSMGGAQALRVGLAHPERFAYVGLFSAGGKAGEDFDQSFPQWAGGAGKGHWKLVWVGCGKDDKLVMFNRDLRRWLDARQIASDYRESEGGHDWRVWRRYLTEITPLLFK